MRREGRREEACGVSHVPLFRDGVRGAGLTWVMEFGGLARLRVQVRASGPTVIIVVAGAYCSWCGHSRELHTPSQTPSFNTPLHFWKVLLREGHEFRSPTALLLCVVQLQPSAQHMVKRKLLCFQRKYV